MIFLRPIIVRDKDTSNLLAVDRYDYMRKQQIKVQPDKSILTDFGSSVTSKLEDGGPFIDLRKQAVPDGQHQPALEQPQPQLQMPKPATVPAPGLLNDRAP
jgi:general secretion pathway protein D